MGIGAGWYYNDVSGDVVHASWFTSIGEGLVPGWHGPYKTEAEAEAHKGTVGRTATPNESVIGGATGAAEQTAGSVFNLGSILGIKGSRSTLERFVTGALGVMLILVGVAKLGEGTPVGNAIKKVPFI
jgi:hypothetical protein